MVPLATRLYFWPWAMSCVRRMHIEFKDLGVRPCYLHSGAVRSQFQLPSKRRI